MAAQSNDGLENTLKNLISKLEKIGDSFPKGAVTTTSDMVPTPATTALGLEAAEKLATTVANEIGNIANTPGDTVVFLDQMTVPDEIMKYRVWRATVDVLKKTFDDINGTEEDSTHPSGKIVAATAVGLGLEGIPVLLKLVEGLFRVDVTEKTGEISIDTATLQSLVMEKLNQTTVYASLDSWANSKMIPKIRQRTSAVSTDLASFQTWRAELSGLKPQTPELKKLIDVFKAMLTTVGSNGLPTLLKLFRGEALDDAFLANERVHFLTLSLVNKPQSTIEIKRWFGIKHFASGFLTVHCRLFDLSGKVVLSKVERQGYMKRIPITGKIATRHDLNLWAN